MRNFVKIGAILFAAVFLGGCFLFGGADLDLTCVNRSLAIASHEAAFYGELSVLPSQALVAVPSFAIEIPGPTSGSATWNYTIEGSDYTGSITFEDFEITTDEGDEYVINGPATLTMTGSFPTYTAEYNGTLAISVNGESAVDADVAVSYTFTVTVGSSVTLDVTTSGTINGVATEDSFSVTFSTSQGPPAARQ
jgi:hypothetical protein